MYLTIQQTLDTDPRELQQRILSENFQRPGKKMMPFVFEEADKNISDF